MLTPTGILPGIVFVESEFLVPGEMATCGPNALAMAESYGTQVYVSTPTIYSRMRAGTWYDASVKAWKKRADPNGASKMGGLDAQAQADKFKTARRDASAGWKQWAIDQLKAGATIIYEPSYGQALHDEISGKGMNAQDLHYHYDLWVGYWPGGFNAKAGKKLDEGFWIADGDNGAVDSNPGAGAPVINGRRRMVNGRAVQFYTVATILKSAPYAFMAVYPKVAPAPPAPVLETFADPKYKGWRFNAAADELYPPSYVVGNPAANGYSYFEKGFARWARAEILAGRYDPEDEPLGREFVVTWVEEGNHAWGDGSIIITRKTYIGWSRPKNTIYRPWAGQELRYVRKLAGLKVA